ncbi:Hypothetical predicted protein [Mytilus galloprovincialis]|uniref:C2H2-type domain-containing protein n=1 Tax=Mytilus galloprovincialis TaxID=29158 RepID=A0A8B6FL41_MYTGA|nr:Hypothetical predicted protein [Mytilus galloprovincialis]
MKKLSTKSPDETIITEPSFKSLQMTIFETTNLEQEIDDAVEKIKETMSKYQREGSGWVFSQIKRLDIHFSKFKPLAGSSFIALPKQLLLKKAIINVKNTDNQCFKWAILSALHHDEVDQKQTDRVKQYEKWTNELNFKVIEFQVSLKAIDKFEKLNPNINVNVLGYETSPSKDELEVYPLKVSKNKGEIMIDLMLLINNDKDGKKQEHYCWVKSLSRLLGLQVSLNSHKVFFCRRCFNHFTKQNILDKHLEYCSQKEVVKIELPEPGTFTQFDNYNHAMRVPFTRF